MNDKIKTESSVSENIVVGFVIVLVFAIILTGCVSDRLKDEELVGVTYPAFFSKRDIIVPIKVSSPLPSGDFIQFRTKSSLEQISESILKWDQNAVAEVYDKSMFISSRNQDTGKNDYYYIYKFEPSGKYHRYMISNFKAVYYDDDDYNVNFMVPVHLLCFKDDDPLFNIGYGDGEKYEMVSGATIEDVYNFYHDSGYYEAEWNGEQVILKQTYFENITESNGYVRNYQLDRPIVIKVWEEDSKTYFTCQVEGEET